MVPFRIFLLSPAHCGGKRATLLLNQEAAFPLAIRLRSAPGASLGEAFSFLSGLYFRGKLTYARRFTRPPQGEHGVQVITPDRGLLPSETMIQTRDLVEFGSVDIDSSHSGYRSALARDVTRLHQRDDVEVVLLGSIATGKYVDVLLEIMGTRLLFPTDFVGRGDMSRGALMLQAAREGSELRYEPVAGAVLRGRRAARVTPAR